MKLSYIYDTQWAYDSSVFWNESRKVVATCEEKAIKHFVFPEDKITIID